MGFPFVWTKKREQSGKLCPDLVLSCPTALNAMASLRRPVLLPLIIDPQLRFPDEALARPSTQLPELGFGSFVSSSWRGLDFIVVLPYAAATTAVRLLSCNGCIPLRSPTDDAAIPPSGAANVRPVLAPTTVHQRCLRGLIIHQNAIPATCAGVGQQQSSPKHSGKERK